MRKKKHGKYRYRLVLRLEEEKAAKLMWEVLVKEVKSKIGVK